MFANHPYHLFTISTQVFGMPRYIRKYSPCASYFFTLNLAPGNDRLLVARIDLLRSAFGRAT